MIKKKHVEWLEHPPLCEKKGGKKKKKNNKKKSALNKEGKRHSSPFHPLKGDIGCVKSLWSEQARQGSVVNAHDTVSVEKTSGFIRISCGGFQNKTIADKLQL